MTTATSEFKHDDEHFETRITTDNKRYLKRDVDYTGWQQFSAYVSPESDKTSVNTIVTDDSSKLLMIYSVPSFNDKHRTAHFDRLRQIGLFKYEVDENGGGERAVVQLNQGNELLVAEIKCRTNNSDKWKLESADMIGKFKLNKLFREVDSTKTAKLQMYSHTLLHNEVMPFEYKFAMNSEVPSCFHNVFKYNFPLSALEGCEFHLTYNDDANTNKLMRLGSDEVSRASVYNTKLAIDYMEDTDEETALLEQIQKDQMDEPMEGIKFKQVVKVLTSTSTQLDQLPIMAAGTEVRCMFIDFYDAATYSGQVQDKLASGKAAVCMKKFNLKDNGKRILFREDVDLSNDSVRNDVQKRMMDMDDRKYDTNDTTLLDCGQSDYTYFFNFMSHGTTGSGYPISKSLTASFDLYDFNTGTQVITDLAADVVVVFTIGYGQEYDVENGDWIEK